MVNRISLAGKRRIAVMLALFAMILLFTGCSFEYGGGSDISEDGSYDQKEEVALYIHEYEHLPSNYITKREARQLGWRGGGLEDYAPGKSIGGDYFGNREGKLPREDRYTECDIDTAGASSRGAKRIVYSDDGDIYYTDDHYNSFTQLYDAEGATE